MLLNPPPFNRAAVLGATGATGRELVAELMRRGVCTRVVSRCRNRLRQRYTPGTVEFFEANIADSDQTELATRECDAIFLCAGAALSEYGQLLLAARNAARASVRHKARLVALSNYWSYMPATELPIREDSGRLASSPWGALRRQAEDIITEAGGTVLHLPDFYGPGAHDSLMNDAISALARGRAAQWPGDPSAPRDFLFLPDLAHPVLELACNKATIGKRLNYAGAGPKPPRDLVKAAAAYFRQSGRIRGLGKRTLPIACLFNPKLRRYKDTYELLAIPAYMSGAQLREAIGDYRATPYHQAIERTVRWLTHGQAGSSAA